jgi:hypothetical protein
MVRERDGRFIRIGPFGGCGFPAVAASFRGPATDVVAAGRLRCVGQRQELVRDVRCRPPCTHRLEIAAGALESIEHRGVASTGVLCSMSVSAEPDRMKI